MSYPKYKPSIAPCAGCEDRHVGCHAECSRYSEWKDTNTKVLNQINQTIKQQQIITSYNVKNTQKINKRRRVK